MQQLRGIGRFFSLCASWSVVVAVSLLLAWSCGQEIEVSRWESAKVANYDLANGKELLRNDSVKRPNLAIRLNLKRSAFAKLRSGSIPASRDTLFADKVLGITLTSIQVINNEVVESSSLNSQFVISERGEGLPLDSLPTRIGQYQFRDNWDFRLSNQASLAPGRYRFVAVITVDQGRSLRDTTVQIDLRR